MEITDLLDKEQWALFEKSLFDRFGINACVYDTEGTGVTGKPNWCNRLCPQIKGNKDSLSAICAPGNQAFMAEARNTRRPVIGECDAGFLKIAVPIFAGDTFLGMAGGCGLLSPDGEVEPFLVQKTLGVEEDEVMALCDDVPRMTEEEIGEMVRVIEAHIAKAIEKHAAKMNAS